MTVFLFGAAYRHLIPPTRVCHVFDCPNHRDNNDVATLGEPVTHKATLFTLHDGVLPVFTTSLYCHSMS